ncbi:MAG: PAS domain-containing protein [Syntrophales bacterium]
MKDISKTKAEIVAELETLRRKVTDMEASCLRYERLIDKISEAKKAWEKTFDVVPDSFAIIGKDHSILLINRPMADLLGLPPEQCIGKKCHQLVHGTDEPPFFCPHVRTMRDALEHRIEIYEESLGGSTIITTSPLTGEDGELIGSVHVAYDITAQANLEESLLDLNRGVEDTNKNLQVAYHWMRDSRDILRKHHYEQDICFLVDRQGQVEWLSDRALAFTGKARSGLIGSNVVDLFTKTDQDKVRDAMKEAWLGIIYPVPVEITTARESGKAMVVKLTRMTSGDSRGLLLLLQYSDEDVRWAGKSS